MKLYSFRFSACFPVGKAGRYDAKNMQTDQDLNFDCAITCIILEKLLNLLTSIYTFKEWE